MENVGENISKGKEVFPKVEAVPCESNVILEGFAVGDYLKFLRKLI